MLLKFAILLGPFDVTEKETLHLVKELGAIMDAADRETNDAQQGRHGVHIYIQSPGHQVIEANTFHGDYIEMNVNIGENRNRPTTGRTEDMQDAAGCQPGIGIRQLLESVVAQMLFAGHMEQGAPIPIARK